MRSIHTREGLTSERLEQILAAAPNIRAIVIGDYFLDKYLITDPLLSERSVETGLEARQVTQIRCSPGAAGTVTNNLAALGIGSIHAVGVIGDDGEAHDLVCGLRATGVDASALVRSPGRFTPTYMKPMVAEAAGERELERLDIKNRASLDREMESRVIESLLGLLKSGEQDTKTAVVVSDQVDEANCGVITDAVRDAVCTLSDERPEVIVYADSRSRIGRFRNVYVKPNQYEAARATSFRSEVGLVAWEAAEVAKTLCSRTGKPVFLTMGEDGIIVADADSVTHVFALPAPQQIDIVGAGDSVTAGIVTALCAGATTVEAACLGNLCASITIRQLGTTGTASPDQLREALNG